MPNSSNTGSQKKKLGTSKADRLFWRRLEWWADGIAQAGIPELRSNGASGWVVMHLMRKCHEDGVIWLWEEIGRDAFGHAKGLRNFEYLEGSIGFGHVTCRKVVNALLKHGWLYAQPGPRGYEVYTPIFKRGEVLGLRKVLPDEKQIQPGEKLVSFLKKTPSNINADFGSSRTDITDIKERRQPEAQQRPPTAPLADGERSVDMSTPFGKVINKLDTIISGTAASKGTPDGEPAAPAGTSNQPGE